MKYKFREGMKVKPTKNTLDTWRDDLTIGKIYTVNSIEDVLVVYDDRGTCYWSMPESYFESVEVELLNN